MEWAFGRISNISSELYISQMSWSEIILWFQGNLQRGLSPSESAKQYYSKAKFTETFSFFFFSHAATARCTKVSRWSRIHHFAGVKWAKPGRCVLLQERCSPSMLMCTGDIYTQCISTCDIPSCAASKSKCSCAPHTFSFKTKLHLIIFRLCLKNQLLHSLNHFCPVLIQKSLACGNTLFFSAEEAICSSRGNYSSNTSSIITLNSSE